MSLIRYRKKRDFKKTPEPKAGKKGTRGSSIFVVQKHAASHLHYDLRLEHEGVLKSWAVPKGLSMDPKDKRLAMMVEDHPYDYKDFEGVIPKGNYGAGRVIVWDNGTFLIGGADDKKGNEKNMGSGLEKGDLKIEFFGKKLRGSFALVKIKKDPKGNSWLLIKERDEFSGRSFSYEDESVISKMTLEDMDDPKADVSNVLEKIKKEFSRELKKEKFPEDVRPMMGKLARKAFSDPEYLYEIKWDGFRAIAAKKDSRMEFYSRNLISFKDRFPELVRTLSMIKFDVVLDGEIIVLDQSGRPSFQLVQNWHKDKKGILVFEVFDILHLDGFSTRVIPLIERKAILKRLLSSWKLQNFKYTDHIEKNGVGFFSEIKKEKMEGIMAKKKDSRYLVGKRSGDWLKIKSSRTQEAVIGGYTEPRGGRKNLGALVLGVYEKGKLLYIGHTGGGFNDQKLRDLKNKLKKIETNKIHFLRTPKTNAPVHWVKPIYVCEVKFSEWSQDGMLRQPIFLRLREDKIPEEVKREDEISVDPDKKAMQKRNKRTNAEKLDLTHLEKVFWPEEGYTKGDLIDYYEKMSRFVLPYIKDRPLSLNRFPNGIKGESFFQKDMDSLPPEWARTHKIYSESNAKELNYIVGGDKKTLLYVVNLGSVELNPWLSRVQSLEYPDYLVLDLDPENIEFKEVARAAKVTHAVLEEIRIPGYLKTSGATGLHIYVPLGAKYDYDQAKEFAQLINMVVNGRLPDTTSLERSPKKRQGCVYLDYLQNRKGQTLAAPYSVRPRPGAPVSTPLEWKELDHKFEPEDFNIKTIFQRVEKKGDIWKGMLRKKTNMETALGKLEKLLKS